MGNNFSISPETPSSQERTARWPRAVPYLWANARNGRCRGALAANKPRAPWLSYKAEDPGWNQDRAHRSHDFSTTSTPPRKGRQCHEANPRNRRAGRRIQLIRDKNRKVSNASEIDTHESARGTSTVSSAGGGPTHECARGTSALGIVGDGPTHELARRTCVGFDRRGWPHARVCPWHFRGRYRR